MLYQSKGAQAPDPHFYWRFARIMAFHVQPLVGLESGFGWLVH